MPPRQPPAREGPSSRHYKVEESLLATPSSLLLIALLTLESCARPTAPAKNLDAFSPTSAGPWLSSLSIMKAN